MAPRPTKRAPSFVDCQGLVNRPEQPEAVAWAEDGTLAVATGPSIALHRPGDLGGPRAFAGVGPQGSVAALGAPGAPADPAADVHHELATLRMAALVSRYPVLQADCGVRGLGWSPAGAGAAGGCLLAAVATDHRVRWRAGGTTGG